MLHNEQSRWLTKSIAVQLLMVLLLLSIISLFSAKMLLTKKVYIIDKTRDIEVVTSRHNVKSLFNSLDIILDDADLVEPDFKTFLRDGMTIEITRAFPVNVEIDGETQKTLTTNNIVEKILNEMNVVLGPLDVVYPDLDGEVFENGLIRITRINEQVINEERKIPYNTIIKMDSKLKRGEEIVEVAGQEGLKTVKERIVIEDGKEVNRVIEEEEIITEKIDRVVRKGSELLYVTEQGKPYICSKIITMRSSAYDLSYESCGKYPGDPAYGITRSGTSARPGVVAVDTSVIKLGTRLFVESLDRSQDYGFASAEDTGGAIKGNRIDLFIGNNREAYRYGMRYVKVYVLEEEIDDSLIVGYGY